MDKQIRLKVYDKCGGRCAYCGKVIELKDMQVDHIIPQHLLNNIERWDIDNIKNLNPTCRRCNHYKRAHPLELFRRMIKTIHQRVLDIYICKVAEDYGIIEIKPWEGLFYFEKVGGRENE